MFPNKATIASTASSLSTAATQKGNPPEQTENASQDVFVLPVQRREHPLVQPNALRRGDICIEYMRGPAALSGGGLNVPSPVGKKLTRLNWWATPRLPRTASNDTARGSINTGHTSVVVDVSPGASVTAQIRVADMRLGGSGQRSLASFDSENVLVYRLRDSALAERLAATISRWTSEHQAMPFSFSNSNAFRSAALGQAGRRKLVHLLRQSEATVLVDPKGEPRKMSCIELTSAAGAVAALSLCKEETAYSDHEAVKKLSTSRRGERGWIFAQDPQRLMPARLHRRLLRDPHSVEIVGHLRTPKKTDVL